MKDIFTKFYSAYIKEIHDFLDSETDILYINGFSGSGKSSVLKSALKKYNKELLKFHYLCFKDTATDDFLLSFYDTFRSYAIKQVINLKKNPESEFLQKVSFYFKNLEYPAVVIIDNFEVVPDNSEITDFLLHISSFDNVQVVVISKNPVCRLIENPTVSIRNLFFEKIDIKNFEAVLHSYFPNLEAISIRELYSLTDGFELYLKMVLGYLQSMNFKLDDFLKEFRDKNISFEDFIVEKQVSLIPNTYYPILENLSSIYHNVSPFFIESYNLGDSKLLPYLISNYMISEFYGTYYIKTYLRKYFSENSSFQNKINTYNKLISIYENELKKSPKDRILRLSRESIRNQIALIEEKIPKVQRVKNAPMFNYSATVKNANWFITAGGAKGKTDVNLSGKKPSVINKSSFEKPVQKEEEKTQVPTPFELAIAKVKEFENEYKYKEALEVLLDTKKLAVSFEDNVCVYSKIALNSIKLNDNNSALLNLRELCEMCRNHSDMNLFAKYRIEIGKIYKKMYAFQRAKACFDEIIKMQDSILKRTLAKAHLALGEIFELENDYENSMNEYKIATSLILEDVGENDILLPVVSFKMASLYDENAYYDEALIEYENSIKYAQNSGNNSLLMKAYTNSGVILADRGDNENAINYLKYALELASGNNNYVDTYYISRNIADIYRNIEPEKAYDYLTMALEYAKLSDNSFEIAISLLELGDFYYNLKQNEQALICYFQAKTTLGTETSKENIERVQTRINDMRIKLGEYIFNGMKELYDPD